MPDKRSKKTKQEIIPQYSSDDPQQSAMLVGEFYAGSLPHPDILQRFDDIVPGSANRLVNLLEGETHHRQRMEWWDLVSDRGLQFLGMLFALLITGFGLYLSYNIIISGHSIAQSVSGTLLGGGVISAIVLGFLNIRKQK